MAGDDGAHIRNALNLLLRRHAQCCDPGEVLCKRQGGCLAHVADAEGI